MNISLRSSFAVRSIASLSALVLGLVLCSSQAGAQTIVIPNAGFSDANNIGTITGTLGGYTNANIGTGGAWRADGAGVLSLLVAPNININGTDLTFGNLLNVGITPALHNSATVFNNDIGADFVSGRTYTLTATFSSNATLNSSVLSAAGFGVSLRAAGTDVANSITQPGLAVALFSGNTGSISLTYTAASTSDIGISMFVGQGGGLASLGLLNSISFDNLTLTAVPEPSTWAAWCGGSVLLMACMMRRKLRVHTS